MKRIVSLLTLLVEFLLSQELRMWLRLLRRPTMVAMVCLVMLCFAAWLDGAVVRAEIFETLPVCTTGQEYDAGLCYLRCPTGYDGVGPVCWEKCPPGYTDDGVTCRVDAHIFGKERYERAPSPLICASHQQEQGGLCYQRCQNGYYGDGPVCWQSCPAGYENHPASCYKHPFDWFFKHSYGRGAGTPLSSCAAGFQKIGALCYPVCKSGFIANGLSCMKPCPLNYKDDGATCRRDVHIFGKKTLERGVGTVPSCAVTSFTRNQLPRITSGGFTMLIASDPQLPWWRGGQDPNCTTNECVKQKAIETNRAQVTAMNRILALGTWPTSGGALVEGKGALVKKPLGVVVNGDLTAFWHPHELDLYRQFYDPGAEHADPNVLQLPIYTGLGNHDYFNNVNTGNSPGNDCFAGTADKFACAKDAVRYMKAMVGCGSVKNFHTSQIKSFDRDSLAYSWEINDYHFVQLNLFPKWENADIGIKTPVPWLKQDLAAATAAGRRIVINMHDAEDSDVWNNDPVGFVPALQGHNVVAIFAGHIHEYFGKERSVMINGRNVPIIYSGAAEYNTFLLAEFTDTYINVAVIDSSTSTPKFANATQLDNLTELMYPGGVVEEKNILFTHPSNDAPVAVDELVKVAANTPISFTLKASDVNGDPLTYVLTESPKLGTLSGTAPNLRYTPNSPFGIDKLTFVVEEQRAFGPKLADTGVVSFLINPVLNLPPFAVDRTLTLSTTGELTVTVSCVDPESDALTYRILERPSNGVLTWVGDDQLIYTPLPGFVGEDSFRFVANDGQNDSNGGKVTVIVNPQLFAPTADNQTVVLRENQPTTITLTVQDPDSSVLTYTLVTTPTNGILTQGNGPVMLYTPHHSFFGTDSFTFRASDGVNQSAIATVTLQVQDENSSPLAHSQAITTQQGMPTPLVLTGEDAEGRPITFTLTSPPQHGSVTGVAPDLFYTSTESYIGEDRLLFQVNDGVSNSTPATVTITVQPAPNEATVVGFFFDDANGNGTLDAGETGIANATVILTGNARAEIITHTDNQGVYRFAAVPFGSYSLRILPPAGTKVEGTAQTQVTVQQRRQVEVTDLGIKVTSRPLFMPLVAR